MMTKKFFALATVLSLTAFSAAGFTPSKASADVEGLHVENTNSASITNTVSAYSDSGNSWAIGGMGGNGGNGGHAAGDDSGMGGAGGNGGNAGNAIITTGDAMASSWVVNTVNRSTIDVGADSSNADIEGLRIRNTNSASLDNDISAWANTGNTWGISGDGGMGGNGGGVNQNADDNNTGGRGGNGGAAGNAIITTGDASSDVSADNTVNDSMVTVSASDDIEDGSMVHQDNSVSLRNALDGGARSGFSWGIGGAGGDAGNGGAVSGDDSSTGGMGGNGATGGTADVLTGATHTETGVVNRINMSVTRVR